MDRLQLAVLRAAEHARAQGTRVSTRKQDMAAAKKLSAATARARKKRAG